MTLYTYLYTLSVIVPVCISLVVTYLGLVSGRIGRARRQEIKQRKVTARAEERAWGLLLSYLSAEQRDMLLEFGYFDMRGSRGKARYRIVVFLSVFNMFEYDSRSRVLGRYCLQSQRHDIPRADQLLTVISLLATDERKFWREANQSNSYHQNIQYLPDFKEVYGRWNCLNTSAGKPPASLVKAADHRG